MIPYGKHHVDEEDIAAVINVLKHGSLTQGPLVEEFEKNVAEYVGVKYAVAVSSGSSALHLAALAAGVEENKYIVTSPITFVSSANSSLYAGGKVLFSDIDPVTINISTELLKQTLHNNHNVCAVVPVHFAGLPCDMDSINKISKEFGICIIEDAAHALGAKYENGDYVGNCEYSEMTIFSFHPVKAIAAGEGGMITTNDEDIYRRILRLRSHGINKMDDSIEFNEHAFTEGIKNPWYYEMQELGFNYRITEIQCALAISQLSKLERFISRRRELVKQYDIAFSDIPNCCPAQSIGRDYSAHHLYVLRINFDDLDFNRAQLMTELRKKNIGTQVHYIPVPAHPYYNRLGFKMDDYLSAKKYYSEALSIPLYYDLTDEDQKHVINVFKEFLS